MMTSSPLSSEQVATYRNDGFLLLGPSLLPDGVLDDLLTALPPILGRTGPETVLERDAVTVRSVYGVHQTDSEVMDIVRAPRLLAAAQQLLEDDVYVHQSKINVKAAFSGDEWQWHQDYIYWQRLDGIRRPDLLNVAVFLDEVTEFNGPLMFIPGSHRNGLLPGADREGMPHDYEDAPGWVSTLTSDEEYQIDRTVIQDLTQRNGLVSAKAPAGSVLLFHSSVLHASLPNISPFGRSVLIFVYNGTGNPPGDVAQPRPEFLAARDITALTPLDSASRRS